DAKYWAIAESRLSSLAYSRAGASGIWQFMKSTAEGYGMKVNSYVDERRNVYKATEAAAKFLKSNYQFLQRYGVNDWLLALSAYNAGP
ncbi:MAG TPA: lytic transglycosylase, partial [Candidatus Cloacimonas sp.]|nr:lytic transglycosylase [Candidatus Cloacimonas sp.]